MIGNILNRIITFGLVGALTVSCGLRLGGDARRLQTNFRIGTGEYIYVMNQYSGDISVLEVESNGEISKVQTVAAESDLQGIAVYNEQFVYASSYTVGTISIFDIDSRNGELELVSTLNEGRNVGRLAVHPTLNVLYAHVYDAGTTENSIVVYSIDEDTGGLTAIQELTNTATGATVGVLVGFTFTPNHKYLVSGSYEAVWGHVHEIDPSDGTLTFRKNTIVAFNPTGVVFPSDTLAIVSAHDDTHIYGATTDPIGWMTFDDDGVNWLNDWTWATDFVLAENNPYHMSLSPDRNYVVASNASDQLSIFAIDESALPASPLTEITGSPYLIPDGSVSTVFRPIHTMFHPDLNVIYVILYGTSEVQAFSYDFTSSTPLTPLGDTAEVGLYPFLQVYINLND